MLDQTEKCSECLGPLSRLSVIYALKSLAIVGMTGGMLLAQANREALKRSVTQVWGETQQSTAIWSKAKSAERAGQHREAAEAYREILKTNPKTLQALNDLALLQAASDDPAVRSPADATANVTRATNVLQDLFHRKTAKQLPDTPELSNLLLNIRATVFHTTAAARAAAGDFNRAAEYARLSLHSAELLAKAEPNAQHQQLVTTIQDSMRLFESKQQLRTVKQVSLGLLEEPTR